jgi:drug/metabolite transporter (DMT)-like permease
MAPEERDRAPSAWRVHGGLVAVQLAFASHYVVSKIVMRELPPSGLAFLRAVLAASFLFAIHLARRGVPRVPLSALPALAGCAVLGIAGNQWMFFHGLRATTATNASVLVTTIPVFTLLASLALRRERARAINIGGVAVALAGVLFLLGAEAFEASAETLIGDLLVLANSVSYGLYLALVGSLVKKHGSLTVVVWLFALGALFLAPLGAGELIAAAPAVAPGTWWLLAWVVLAASIFTYLVNAWALGHAPPSTVAVYIYLQPLGATVLAVLVLDEAIPPRLVAAALTVFAGIYLSTRPAPIPRPA